MKEIEQAYKTTKEAVDEMNKNNDLLTATFEQVTLANQSKQKSVLVSHNQVRALRYGGPNGR